MGEYFGGGYSNSSRSSLDLTPGSRGLPRMPCPTQLPPIAHKRQRAGRRCRPRAGATASSSSSSVQYEPWQKLRLSHDALQLALSSKGTEPATCRGDHRKSIRLVRCYREPKYLPSFANVTLSTGLWAAGRRILADMSLIASKAQRVAMHVCGAEGRVASEHELLGEDSTIPTHPHAIPPNGMFTRQCPHKIVTTDGVLPNLVLSMRPSLGSSAKAPQGRRTLAASLEDRSIPTVC
ncbi:hypothetical protein GQ607_003926 [Colletotrichum asianum]|uniref:Uncharacterized protein n=1 Tax=Colletotrichum asianum TaxID=702518 RepID=A0A8H3ZVS2_9PEZI|nr:hypothetical protein GQ607_003926 [Colletotrichum asianum]